MSRRDAGIGPVEVLLSVVVVMVIGALLFPLFARAPRHHHHSNVDAQNIRQIALAAIIYGGDFDDRIPLTINGRLDRLQNRHDWEKTINCPGAGTQDLPSDDAAGASPSRTWVHLLKPYTKSRGLLISPKRGDVFGYFAADPFSATDAAYRPEKNTYRNQGRFPYFGLNYMFLAPLRIPISKLSKPNAINYAEGVSKSFAKATEPEATVFFVCSQQAIEEPNRGFFVVNAPGMWPAFAKNKQGYVAFWGGNLGGGDWVGTPTACPGENHCSEPTHWEGFVYTGFNGGTNATFLDGHVKYLKAAALATGTNYASATAGTTGSLGSGAVIVDKHRYLWDYDGKDFYGL